MFCLSIPEEISSVESSGCASKARMTRLAFFALGLLMIFGIPGRVAAAAGGAPDGAKDRAKVAESYGKVPLSFEPNRGQISAEVQWVARGPEYVLFLAGHDAVLELNSATAVRGSHGLSKGEEAGNQAGEATGSGTAGAGIKSAAIRMNLLGASAGERTSGEGQQAGTANYFTGNDPLKWQQAVPNFAKVRLSQVYPGIDLVYYGRQGRLEYDFVVAAGADPAKIALKFEGAEARLAENGDLILPVAGTEDVATEAGQTGREVRFDKPTVYQMKDGVRQPVAGSFQLARNGTVSFALGSYDRSRELVIDPTLLFAGSLATGNQQTIPLGMTIDATGAMYLTGYTNDLTYPVTMGAFQTNCQVPTSNGAGAGRCGPSSNTSGFVTKISADGTSLVYSTYLHGGGGYEQGQSIVVDATGDAYVLGSTSSNDFPVTSNAYQSLCQPSYSQGAYFAPMLPITAQCDNFHDGGGTEYTVNGPNLFIAKLNPAGTALLYSTFFGGSASVYPVGIALDPAGNIYFASEVNQANSPANLYPNNSNIPFPTTPSGYQTTGIDVQTPALSELSADGQTLLYSTFLGSQSQGVGHDSYNQAFALGQNGVAFFGGFTQTSDFPTTAGSFKPACTPSGNNASYCNTSQGFVAAIDTTKVGAASLVYASYLGGEEAQTSNIPEQEVYGLAADAANDLFVTGYSSANDFPSTAGVYQPHCNDVNAAGTCEQTAFLSKINPAGSALTWSTLLGDTRDNGPGSYGTSIAFDSKGQVYLYGESNDGSGNFPQVDPISTYTGGNKVFVATFSADATQLLFSTRFSGPANNGISLAPSTHGLAVDATGSMYIVGYTGDNGSFGTTAGTYSTTATAGFNRPFFAKISPITPQSSTTLTISPGAATSGQNITFTVAVAGVGQTTPIPTGTVALLNTAVTPSATIGTITLDATGAGSFSSTTIPMGSYTIVASYSGDTNYEYSQSAPQALNITTLLTTNLLLNPGAELGSLADWTPGAVGAPEVDNGLFDSGIKPHTGTYDFVGGPASPTDTLSQTVSVIQQGITTGQIDGGAMLAQVSFWEQGLNQGTPSDDGFVTLTFLDANNAAISTATTSTVDSHGGAWTNESAAYAIPVGTRSITYVMNFMRNQQSDNDAFIDDNSLSVASAMYTGQPVTSTALTSTPAAPSAGQTVTFSVAVAGMTQTTPVPTGMVTLMNTAVTPAATLGTITLGATGTGTFSTATLGAGSYSITAMYGGDETYAASTSAADMFTVTAPVAAASATTLSVTPAATGAQGTVFTLTATVVSGGSPVTGGTVKFLDGTKVVASVQVVSATGVATYKTRSFGVGSHALTATFTGTAFNTASTTAAPVTLTVTGKYATTATLVSTGVQGSYALAATVDGLGLGSPTGNVIFTDTSTNSALGTMPVGGAVESFVPGTPIAAGSSALQVISADVNGDGNMDLVEANSSGRMVTVLLGKGDGTYTALPAFGTNYDGITGVAVADFNGDGKLDIATANQSTVGIFLGNGDGTFGAEQDFANTNTSAGVFAGDFNGDGKLDLAVPDRYNGMTILIGNGDGTFSQPNPAFAVGTSPNYHSAIADFNGDGKLDIAAGNFFDNTVSILIGNGDGTFQAPVTYATGSAPTATFAGDFNGDGFQDIFLSNANDGTISVLLGNGDGTFKPQKAYAVGANPYDASVGDLNGDGKLDIAVANVNDGTVSILLGNGDGTFQPQQVLTSGSTTESVTIADPNGDGSLDVEAANYGNNTVTVFLNEATATASLAGVTLPGTGMDGVVATYSGDNAFMGSMSNTLTLPSMTAVTPTIVWAMPAAITTATPLSATQLDATATDASGTAVAGTFVYTPAAGALLPVGTQTLSVMFTPTSTAAFTTATGTTTIVVTQAATGPPAGMSTTTTLTVTSGGGAVTAVAAGSVVTLTASVHQGATAVVPAQVEFCDATAASCTGPHLLGVAQMTAAGTAVLRFVPGIGAHSYKAMFGGTVTGTATEMASASAAAALAVTGTYPTATTIAQAGSPGNYTLTATTVGLSPQQTQVAAQSVTINLGQSTQNYVLTGTGATSIQGGTYGNYYNTQGACVTAGATTTCDLTGAFTSTSQGYAAGIYDFQTVFTGGIAASITSQTQSPVGTNEPNDFQYSGFAPSLTMTLKLVVTGGGTYSIPLVANQNYAPNLDNINFAYAASTCGGTSLGTDPCQQDYVGTVAGATVTGPVTGLVMFETSPSSMGAAGPTGTVSFLDTSNANAALGTGALGASTPGFGLVPATGSPVAVGAGAYGAATGDFNGDGFADVVVENYSAGTVSVMLGKGDGTFLPQVTYAVGGEPERVLVADLNGDGKLDLVVANTASSTISVLLGVGDGTFLPQVTYPCASPVGLGVMDINHDGIPDVVAGDYYANTMSVLLGVGDGTLAAAVTYPTGSTPQTVAEGDFNGDGNVDVVVGNEGAATVGVFLGNGDGTFKAMVTYAVGNLPQGVQVGDFNGDGKLDLAVSNQGDGTVSVLLGDGDGTFGAQATYAVGVQPVGIEVADFNGDGILDITVGNTGQASLTQGVLLGKGDGTFLPQVTFATGNFPYGVAIADFNGDGLPDMVVSDYTDATATILLSQATQTAVATAAVTALTPGTHAAVASYPGDANYKASVSQATNLSGAGATAPVITWTPTVATIAYGTALGTQQLDAAAVDAAGVAIPGTFVYTPAAGTVLTAGVHTLSVAFTPTGTGFSAGTGTATITVTQAMPVITWAAPAGIAYGTPLSATQLDATVAGVGTGALAGTLVYSPAAGTVLAPGTQMLSVVFTPMDAADYTTATATVPITVGGLALTSFTPMGALLGSTDTKITLTGTGFVATSVVMVNGAPVATAFVSAAMLTAVIPAALLRTAGALAVMVADPSIGAATAAQTFTVLPASGVAMLIGPSTTPPGSQPSVGLTITNPYPLPLTAVFNLSFASAGTTPVDDPSIQFSSGGRTFSYDVAANSTTVPPVQLQAGTDAGTITITATLMADGVDVTPTDLAPLVIVVPPVVPVISGTTVTAAGDVLTVVVHGFSNTREVSSAVFNFTAATGDTLATSMVTIPATMVFSTWYTDPTSDAYGSTFTYTQVFNTSSDASTIGAVTVTLTNSIGTSLVSASGGASTGP